MGDGPVGIIKVNRLDVFLDKSGIGFAWDIAARAGVKHGIRIATALNIPHFHQANSDTIAFAFCKSKSLVYFSRFERPSHYVQKFNVILRNVLFYYVQSQTPCEWLIFSSFATKFFIKFLSTTLPI